MERRVVAIVGGGISGLLACKYTISKGFHPVLFESQDTIGGVWTRTSETTHLQTVKDMYQFSDFPWPSFVKDELPSAEQVLEYIHSYAQHFDFTRYVRLNTKVTSIDYDGPAGEEVFGCDLNLWNGTGEGFNKMGKWQIFVEDLQNQSTETLEADFVILCLGRFSGLPNMPHFPHKKGPEVFKGQVIHSMDYAALDNNAARDLIKGKSVAVVGFQKSALDIAMECSISNGVEKPCTLVCRRPNWNIVARPWGIPLDYLYGNRFSELLVHKPGEGALLSLLATILSPLRWTFSKIVEIDLKWRLPLKRYGMVPDHGFLQDVNSCSVQEFPKGFFEHVDKGSIVLKRSPAFSFCEQGIMLEGKEKKVEIDLVIMATGFRGLQKFQEIFRSPRFQECIAGSSSSSFPLYRETIHPRIPQLAVIGFSDSISNLYVFEMECRWLVELLDGSFKLPNIQEMEKDIFSWEKFKKRYAGGHYWRSCIRGIHIWYNDQLCKDMGWNPKRKKGFFAELFEPYGPSDYTQN